MRRLLRRWIVLPALIVGLVLIGTWKATSAQVTTYAADFFNRTGTGGWGRADLGGGYTLGGATADFAVTGTAGTIRMPTAGTGRSATLTSVSARDVDITVQVQTDKSPTGTSSGQTATIVARRVDNANQYHGSVRFLPNGTLAVYAAQIVGGAETGIGAQVVVPGLTYAPNTWFWLRMQVTGVNPTTIRLRAWADGQVEPTTWPYTGSNSAAGLQVPGAVGLRSYLSSSTTNAPVMFTFDTFEATSVRPLPPACDPTYPAPGCDSSGTGPQAINARVYLPLITRGGSPKFEQPPPGSTGPTLPADTYYVRDSWALTVTLDTGPNPNRLVRLAYRIGYNADVGDPLSRIILGFGSQTYRDVTYNGVTYKEWLVDLPFRAEDGGSIHEMQWVRDRIREFMQGYSANHGRTSIIAIGTSNYNEPWLCDNPSGFVSEDFQKAGAVWGDLVDNISPTPRVLIRSAMDFEAWSDPNVQGEWIACGFGATQWFDGFVSETPIYNINFGSHAYNEAPQQWDEYQLYDVSYGRFQARVNPQMYCDGQATPWVGTRSRFPDLRFFGVTADDNFPNRTICDPDERSLGWRGAWPELNDALTAAGYPNNVSLSVSSFNYPTRTYP